jgi:phage replication O-like protein O
MAGLKGFQSPNYTQVPNDLFDTIMADMEGAELKVVLAIVRQTIGYHRDRSKYSMAKLAILTGLSHRSVVDGALAAESRGLIQRTNPGSQGSAEWEVIINDGGVINSPPAAAELPDPDGGVKITPLEPAGGVINSPLGGKNYPTGRGLNKVLKEKELKDIKEPLQNAYWKSLMEMIEHDKNYPLASRRKIMECAPVAYLRDNRILTMNHPDPDWCHERWGRTLDRMLQAICPGGGILFIKIDPAYSSEKGGAP